MFRLLLALPAACWLLAAFQSGSTVEGTVVNSATGAPVRKAVVTMQSPKSFAGYQAVSGLDGRFVFTGVLPGDYFLSAEAQGFARSAGAPPVSARDGQSVQDCVLRLQPFGAIEGAVKDENGEPVARANVELLRYAYWRDGKRLEHAGSTTSDDRGVYRLFGVRAGRYLMKVSKDTSLPGTTGTVHTSLPQVDYATTFYPNAAREDEAEIIALAAGAEMQHADFRLRMVPVYHLRGTVLEVPAGRPVSDVAIQEADEGWSAKVRPDGGFDIPGVRAGVYKLHAVLGGRDEVESAVEEVTVADRDVNGLIFRLERVVLSGTVLAEGAASFPGWGGVMLVKSGEPGGVSTTIRDGMFRLPGVPPGTYRITASVPARSLYLKSVQYGSEDASETGVLRVGPGPAPLTLTLGSDVGSVNGSAAGQGTISVVLVPRGRFAARSDWVHTVQPKADGSFQIGNVPPGEYAIFAFEISDQSLAEYPEFERLFESTAVAVTVRPGESESVKLTPVPAADIEDATRRLR